MSERKVAREWKLKCGLGSMFWWDCVETPNDVDSKLGEIVRVREVFSDDPELDQKPVKSNTVKNDTEMDQAVAELVSTVQKFAEYFGAIQRGEYDNNRRPAPLRPYEELILDMAEDVLAKFKEQRGVG